MMSYIVERKALKGLSVSWQTVRVVRVILLLSTSQQIFKEWERHEKEFSFSFGLFGELLESDFHFKLLKQDQQKGLQTREFHQCPPATLKEFRASVHEEKNYSHVSDEV